MDAITLYLPEPSYPRWSSLGGGLMYVALALYFGHQGPFEIETLGAGILFLANFVRLRKHRTSHYYLRVDEQGVKLKRPLRRRTVLPWNILSSMTLHTHPVSLGNYFQGLGVPLYPEIIQSRRVAVRPKERSD